MYVVSEYANTTGYKVFLTAAVIIDVALVFLDAVLMVDCFF